MKTLYTKKKYLNNNKKKEVKTMIRYLRFSDTRQAVEIYNQSLKFLSRNEPISEEKMRELIRKSKKRFFIGAFLNKKMIGHLLLTADAKEKGVLNIGIVIHPDYQGIGMGTILIKKAFEIAKSKGYRKIIAEILENNSNSIRFFKKNGFRVVGLSDRIIIKGKKKVRVVKCEFCLESSLI